MQTYYSGVGVTYIVSLIENNGGVSVDLFRDEVGYLRVQ